MNTAVPAWFRPVAVLALLWNLLGCAAYVADVVNADAARPAWAVAGTALAVWLGAAGSLGLLLRRRWAVALLSLSLAGVVLQDLWLFILGNSHEAWTPVVLGLQLAVLAVAVGLFLLARDASRRRWLT